MRNFLAVGLTAIALVATGVAISQDDNQPPLDGKMEDMGLQPVLPVQGDRAGSPWSAMQHWTNGHARTFIVDVEPERKKGKREALRKVFNACADGKWQMVGGKISVMKYTGRHESTPEHAYFVKCDE